MSLHIGEKIKIKAGEKRIGPSELGRMINTSKQNIYSIYRRRTIDTDLLLKLCKALDFDFFQFYTEKRDPKGDRKAVSHPPGRNEMAELKKERDQLKEKCELLEKLNSYLEKEVAYLKKKK